MNRKIYVESNLKYHPPYFLKKNILMLPSSSFSLLGLRCHLFSSRLPHLLWSRGDSRHVHLPRDHLHLLSTRKDLPAGRTRRPSTTEEKALTFPTALSLPVPPRVPHWSSGDCQLLLNGACLHLQSTSPIPTRRVSRTAGPNKPRSKRVLAWLRCSRWW